VVDAIRKRIGARGDVTIEPTLFAVVVGDPGVYQGAGAMLNLTCAFANDSRRLTVIHRLELEGQGPGGRGNQLRCDLFFETEGREQTKVDASARIELPPGAKKELGVQFQGPLLGDRELWPIGDYAFELLGWAHDRTSQEKANLLTTFRASLSPPDAAWL